MPGPVVPRTAAENTARTIICRPSTAVRWGTFVVIAPAVSDPFPNVAVSVIEPELICVVSSHQDRLVGVIIRFISSDIIAGIETCCRARTGYIFSLRLAKE
jgi:hypothetical protein